MKIIKEGSLYIGTSGWHYKHWKGPFYPENIKANELFQYYQRFFNTVEINNSFYKLPTIEALLLWKKNANRDFIFSMKASRFITHMKKLKDPIESIYKFFDRIPLLEENLGPILFQLPPDWKFNEERLEAFLMALPRGFRYVFEFRNPTWFCESAYSLLKRYNCSLCIFEIEYFLSPFEITSDFIYVRLHGPEKKYTGLYDEQTLSWWAHKCKEWLKLSKDVYIYFDNDQNGYAVLNAITLKKLIYQ